MNTLWFNWFMAEYRSVAALPWPEYPWPEYPTEMKGLMAALIAGVVSRELDNPETERIVRDLLIEPKRVEGVSVWDRLSALEGGEGDDRTPIAPLLFACWSYLYSPVWKDCPMRDAYKIEAPFSRLYQHVLLLARGGYHFVRFPPVLNLFRDHFTIGTARSMLLNLEDLLRKPLYEVELERLCFQWFPQDMPLQWIDLSEKGEETEDWRLWLRDINPSWVIDTKCLNDSPLPYGFWEPAAPYLPLQPEEDINVLKNKVRDLLRLCNEKNTPEEINRRWRQNR